VNRQEVRLETQEQAQGRQGSGRNPEFHRHGDRFHSFHAVRCLVFRGSLFNRRSLTSAIAHLHQCRQFCKENM
jgi:hypothetical protein